MKTNVIRWSLVVMVSLMTASMGVAEQKPAAEKKEKKVVKKKSLVFTGKGRERDSDEKAALRKATEAAKADALEKAAEYLITKEKDKNLRYIANRYVNEKLTPDECFDKFEVTNKKRPKYTTYVTGEATLNDTLSKTIAKLRKRFETRGYPKVMVVLNEEVIQPRNLPPIPPTGMTAQIAIEKALIKADLTVVDRGTVTENERKAIQAAVMKGDLDAVVRLTRKHGANVTLSGPPARADYRGNIPMGVAGTWPRYGAIIQVRVVESDIGQLLAAQDSQGMGAGETNIPAVHNAFKKTGSNISKDLLKDIFWFWFGKDQFNIRVYLRGIPHNKARDIAEALVEEEDWAKRHGTVEMKEGECTFVLTVVDPATSGMVADVIRQINKKLKVTTVTKRRVALQKKE